MGLAMAAPLHFAFVDGVEPPHAHGPVEALVFDASTLQDQCALLIARHVGHRWRLPGGESFARFECPYPVSLFTRASPQAKAEPLGRYSALSCVNGMMYGGHRLIAMCDDRQQDWYVHELALRVREIIVRPAE